MATVYCTQCGHANPQDARFCANCGTALTRAGEPVGDASSSAGSTTATLTWGIDLAESTPPEDDAAGADVATVEALQPGTAMLVVRRGPNAGSRFLLDREVTTVGRHAESDIFFDDITVSRRHAEFRRSGSTFSVADVGSLNGTYVNKERIDTAGLAGGDEVMIGKFRMVFFEAPEAGQE